MPSPGTAPKLHHYLHEYKGSRLAKSLVTSLVTGLLVSSDLTSPWLVTGLLSAASLILVAATQFLF